MRFPDGAQVGRSTRLGQITNPTLSCREEAQPGPGALHCCSHRLLVPGPGNTLSAVPQPRTSAAGGERKEDQGPSLLASLWRLSVGSCLDRLFSR